MSEALELVTAQQERATAVSIYGQDDQVKQMIQAVRTVAPWINNRDPKLSFSDNEVALVVRRAMAMGLDPLNPHEVQIWKDNRGSVNFQISYTLMAEWVRRFKGTHTEPEYHRLTKEELIEEGLQQTDVAYRVSFVMDDSIDKLMVLAQVYGAEKARAMVAVTGFGCAKASEYSSEYFAPAGRSKTWKVQKRAMVDAYRRKFGTPTRAEIEELRRIGGFERVRAEDWEGTEDLHPGDAAALVQFRGQWREHEERLESDPEYRAEKGEQTKAAMAAMYPDAQTVEAEIVSDDYETANAQEAAEALYPEATDAPTPEQPDLWDREAQTFVADVVKVLATKAGKPYIVFSSTADNLGAAWWKGRDAMLEAAPWIGTVYTKEHFGTVGVELPLVIRVRYEQNGQYLNAVSFERVGEDGAA